MNQIHDRLDDAIGVAPPTTVEVDRLMATQRKRAVARRWGGAGGVAAAVLGIAVAGAVILNGGAGPARMPVGGPGSPAAKSSPHNPPATVPTPADHPSPAEPVTCPADERQPNEVGARLGRVLGSDVQRLVPDMRVIDRMNWHTKAWDFHHECQETNLDSSGAGQPGVDMYHASGDLEDAKGTGSLEVLIGVNAAPLAGETSCDGVGPEIARCSQGTGPKGEIVIKMVGDGERGGQPGAIWHRVAVNRPEGTVVLLIAYNWGFNGATDPKVNAPTRATPPLTLDQLVEIGLNPELSVR